MFFFNFDFEKGNKKDKLKILVKTRQLSIFIKPKLTKTQTILLQKLKLKKMKKTNLLLIFLLFQLASFCQGNQVNIPSFRAKPVLPASTADWASTPGALIMIAQKVPQANIGQFKLMVSIKQNDSKVCGSTFAATGFVDSFGTKTYQAGELTGILGNCDPLKPGGYTICAQFVNADNRAISKEVCANFKVEGGTPQTGGNDYTPPQNLMPIDGKMFDEKEAKAPVTFRWTPVLPKPQGSIIYRLKVWQLMQGQNGTQAMKANTPVIEKEVKGLTQTVVNNLITERCREPYRCDWVWYVEAANEDGKVLGVSGLTVFGVNSAGCGTNNAIVNIKCDEIVKGKQTYAVDITFNNTIPTSGGQQCTTVMNAITSSTGVIASVATLPVTIPIGASSTAVTFIYTPATSTATTADFSYTGTWNDGNSNTSNFSSLKIKLPIYKCDLCDKANSTWEIQSQIYYDSTSTNNILTLHNDISFGPHKIVKLSAEVVDFYWFTEGDCKKCSSNDYYWGNLISGSIKSDKFTQGVSAADADGIPLPSSHQLDFLSIDPAGANISSDVYLNLSLPPQTQLGCCTDCFRFCVRYTVTFMQDGVCKTCGITKCFETKRKHRKTMLQHATNQCGDKIIFNNGGLQETTPVLNKLKN